VDVVQGVLLLLLFWPELCTFPDGEACKHVTALRWGPALRTIPWQAPELHHSMKKRNRYTDDDVNSRQG
jgi:hypothetical protein